MVGQTTRTIDRRPSRRRLRLLVAPLVLLAWVVAAGAAPARASTAAGPPVIGCDQAATMIVVHRSVDLDPTCTYTGGIQIGGSHLTLDCRGARVDEGDGRTGVGILITAPVSADLRDITVRNCVVHGFLDGMRVTRVGFKSLAPGHEYDHDYSLVRIEHDRISDTGGVGLYVDAYVTGVTIDDDVIAGAGSTGIYLEAGSRATRVTHSTVEGNGFAGTDPAGVPVQVGSVTLRYLSTGREGIAVDGSQDNTIRDNVIRGNSYGGIFLYENCGEYATQDPADWWPRRTGADGNSISFNTIADEANGVWIGSRMAENLVDLDCSTPPYDTGGGAVHILDHATGNTVYANVFSGDTHGVRVEDDDNRVVRNRFVDASTPSTVAAPVDAVLIGTDFRTAVLGRPVTATVVESNVSTLSSVTSPFGVIWAPTATTVGGNRQGGTVVGLAPGVQPPIDPLLMVVRIWLPAP